VERIPVRSWAAGVSSRIIMLRRSSWPYAGLENWRVEPVPSDLLDLDVIAERLHITRRSVLRYVRQGKLPAVHLSKKKILIRAADLDAFIQSRLLESDGLFDVA
jgi:excisionase family DNA binding protein